MLFPLRICPAVPTHLLIAPLMHMQSFKQIAVIREEGSMGSTEKRGGENNRGAKALVAVKL